MSDFKDFIPEGEDTGAQGDGFTDFVPPKEPTKPVEVEPEVRPEVEPKVEPTSEPVEPTAEPEPVKPVSKKK